MIGATSALQMGCAFGVATILSVGPTNLTVIREGLMRGRIWLVVFLFSTIIIAAMLLAHFVADLLEQLDPAVQNSLSWTAVAVMLYFAFKSFRAASRYRPPAFGTENHETALACACRVLPIVLLNPLVYLEFFFLPAAIFQTLNEPWVEIAFIAGVAVVAFSGFCAYGFGGRFVSKIISRNGTLRIFDCTCGVILSGVATVLAVSLLI